MGRHEPRSALDGGVRGVDWLAPIAAGARRWLLPGGFLALETDGGTQSQAVAAFLAGEGAGFRDVRLCPDLAGVQRFVVASRSE